MYSCSKSRFFGRVQDFTELSETCHQYGALLIIAVTEIISLGALTNPGEMGADIVSGEGQSLGNPISFGGPHVGLLYKGKVSPLNAGA